MAEEAASRLRAAVASVTLVTARAWSKGSQVPVQEEVLWGSKEDQHGMVV